MVAGVDRRVARTRRLLAEALLALILDRGYDRITVQDILDRADVGRSTFYTHFRDKQALLLSCFDGLRDELGRELDATVDTGPLDAGRPAYPLFAHAYRNRRVYRALCGRRGGSIVYDHLHALVRTNLAGYLAPRATAAPVPDAEALAEFCASALLGLLVWWVGQDFPFPPARLARLYGQLATPGIRSVTGYPAGAR
jgi:AcrR family transcriptional regulator